MAYFETTQEVFSAKIQQAEQFLPITLRELDGSVVTHYGGDQAWFHTRVGRVSGCGAVAAADIFAYRALRDPKLAALFQPDAAEISVDCFRTHMHDVIEYVAPLKIPHTDIPYGGLTSLERFTRYADNFLKSRGVGLKGQYCSAKELNLEQAAETIAGQLRQDNPLALLVMQNSSLKHVAHLDARGNPAFSDVRFHWMVITVIEQSGDKIQLTVSSEGCRLTLDFTDVWTCDAASSMGWRGIVYFQ